MQPWFTTILKAFGPQRMMFGSDWPVCTVGMESAWACWREVVEAMCLSAELEEGDVERVFSGTAREVYRL
jgi:L-rhamnono-1,4-lactonase